MKETTEEIEGESMADSLRKMKARDEAMEELIRATTLNVRDMEEGC